MSLPQFPPLPGEKVTKRVSGVSASPDVCKGDLRASAAALLTCASVSPVAACTLPAPLLPSPQMPSVRAERPPGIRDVRNPQKVAGPLCEPLNWVIREGGTSVVLKAWWVGRTAP